LRLNLRLAIPVTAAQVLFCCQPDFVSRRFTKKELLNNWGNALEGKAENVVNDKFEYSRFLLVFGNVAVLLWAIVATLAFWFDYAAVAWAFLILAFVMVYLLLRRSGCNTCAYCKTCTMGFGRLSAWFFGKRELKDLNNKSALVLVALVYCLLAPIPIAFLTFSVTLAFAVSKVAVLLCLLAFSVYSALTWRKPHSPQTPKT
jgi:hypothetical protein